ncbi:hypothetical protein HanHA300_Chr16g0589931 [Helianthus annuus]|nr:hypothetical protein HanHA300_Chr16g0589931 [Helianthus annuus]KAJ0458635.1 hypothetical protein HanHA89_Chr16g0640041 [Helianthus annuus]KAJ0639176.1 hypothetical protein HanLR1_Chr16g0600961 [Helianthus annuus]KAJ0643141.1 hypothetical protein HanOQP8_Chr16g0597331 [Helianthus annuus]
MMSTFNNLFALFLLLVSNDIAYGVVHHASSYPSHVSNVPEQHVHAPIVEQPLAKIDILKAVIALHESASIRANPFLLGSKVRKCLLHLCLHIRILVSFIGNINEAFSM